MAETKLEFYPDKDGEQAGLTCYYSTATYARCSLCYEGGRKIQLVINRNHGEELIAEVDNVKETPVYLKVVVEKLTRTFYYSYDGQNGKRSELWRTVFTSATRACPTIPSVTLVRW